MSKSYAVVAITKHGVSIARELETQLGQVLAIYYPQKLAHGDEESRGIHCFAESVVVHVPTLFSSYRGLIGIFSLGAMIRLIAPLLKDKKTDPAVVVIDDRAEFVISVLSGHLGGANDLTRMVAHALHATPVITTASDVGQTLAVDLLGRNFGWEIDNFDKVTQVSAAVVNEERIALIQEAGERNWWTYDKPLPAHIQVFHTLDEARDTAFDAALIITPRLLSADESALFLRNGVLYRPKVMVLGIGCNRGTEASEIESVVRAVLQEVGLAIGSVRNIATIDKKADEVGLIALCQKFRWPMVTYTAGELNTVAIPNPSSVVFEYVGAYGVAEPAARLSARASDWVVEKVRSGNVTVSVCMATQDR